MSGSDERRAKLFAQLSDVEATTKELAIREGILPVAAQATIVDDLNEIRHILTTAEVPDPPTAEESEHNLQDALDASLER